MEDEVRKAALAFAAALRRGDAAAVAALYAEDGKLLTPAAELIAGTREIEAYWRAGLDVGLLGIELCPVDVEHAGAIAVELGSYVLSLDGDRGGERGKYVALHRRQADGSWRRAVDVFNPDVPEAARRNHKEEA